MLSEETTKEICRGCDNCSCEKGAAVRAMHHNDTIHLGPSGCEDRIPIIEFKRFGQAYVPDQELCEVYKANIGFVRGTIFPELDFPYEPRWPMIKENEGGGNNV